MDEARYEYRTFEADNGRFWVYQQVGVYDHPDYGECVFTKVTYPIAASTYILELVRKKK